MFQKMSESQEPAFSKGFLCLERMRTPALLEVQLLVHSGLNLPSSHWQLIVISWCITTLSSSSWVVSLKLSFVPKCTTLHFATEFHLITTILVLRIIQYFFLWYPKSLSVLTAAPHFTLSANFPFEQRSPMKRLNKTSSQGQFLRNYANNILIVSWCFPFQHYPLPSSKFLFHLASLLLTAIFPSRSNDFPCGAFKHFTEIQIDERNHSTFKYKIRPPINDLYQVNLLQPTFGKPIWHVFSFSIYLHA